MAQQPVIMLGNVSFLQREIPDTINFGGKQMLAIHKNLGGYRTIDAMGADPADISWAGHFLTVPDISGSATQRARAVDTMRQSGAEVTLLWGSFSFQVVVKQFSAIYKHEWEVSYKISCSVLSDNGVQTFILPTLSDVVNNDISSIKSIANAAPAVPASTGSATIPAASMTALNNAVTDMQTAIGSGSLDGLSLTQLQPVIASFQNAYSVFSGSGTPNGMNLDAITGASTLDGIATFVAEANNVAVQSDMQTALFYLGRIIANLSGAGG